MESGGKEGERREKRKWTGKEETESEEVEGERGKLRGRE